VDERGFLDAIRADPADEVSRRVYADWLDERGQSEQADFVRLHLAMRAIEPDHPQWHAGECELSLLRKGADAGWLAVIEPERTPLPAAFERPSCDCFAGREGGGWREPRLHRELQDTECDAWKRLLGLIEDVARDGRRQLDLRQALSWEETMQIVTLPPTIAMLKEVTHLELYASHLVRLPPEVGEMTSLVDFDPYTSWRLHWFPYEITRCTSLARSRVSTRVLYGNYKYNPPFPGLRRPRQGEPAPVLPLKRFAAALSRDCSVCGRRYEDEGRFRAWVTLRVATDDLPLLINACSRACLDEVPRPPDRYRPCPHSGGLSPKHFRRRG